MDLKEMDLKELAKAIGVEQVAINYNEPFEVSCIDKNGYVHRSSYADAPKAWFWCVIPESFKITIFKRISH